MNDAETLVHKIKMIPGSFLAGNSTKFLFTRE